MARSVWALSLEEMVEHMRSNQDGSAKNWLFAMHDSLIHNEFNRMVVTLWAVWSARRKANHGETYQSLLSNHCFISSFLSDIQILSKPAKERRNPLPRSCQWIPPLDDHVKFNVDATVSTAGGFGAPAAICRSVEGNFLGASE